ncbi:hypothetical protein [Microbacterium sp. 18062]|uniref:hypothetical protein n=1 Tax=Microbacterium sp. 18062 TaxID=2681410 RepID=UPI00135786A8|nr:hypothetical protein [Microbacterium sp. 18062]
MNDPDPTQPSSKPIPIPSFRPSQVFRRRRGGATDQTDAPMPDAAHSKRRRDRSA